MFLLADASLNYSQIIEPIENMLGYVLIAAMSLVFSVGMVWCVVLGVKYARAEEAQDRDKAKGALRNAIIGFVLIFVLIAVLYVAKDPLINWLSSYATGIDFTS